MIKMTRKQRSTISVLKYGNGTVDTTFVSQNVPRKARKLRFYCVFCKIIFGKHNTRKKGRKVGSGSLSVTYDTIKSANRMFGRDRNSTLL